MQPILKVDIGRKQFEIMNIPEVWEKEYIGGSSLAARILYPYLVQELDPLSPEAPLLFMTGPLTGTSGPAVGRYVICGKSPATKLWAESNCGGFWGPELRKAGYDGLFIEGRSDHPVYLLVTNNKIEILDANQLWGLDTYQTQSKIIYEQNNTQVRIASIGIAGENKIPYASVLSDHGRVAGRTGMGAVMGSKNLKAVVVHGNSKIPIKNFSEYKILRSKLNRELRHENEAILLRELGTGSAAEYFDYIEEMPKRYFHKGKLDYELAVSGANLKDTILSGVSSCHACVIACGRVVKLEDGLKRKGPEYETMVGFGPNLLINDSIFVTRMGELCDRYGMDTISSSNVIGFAFHLYDKGVITSSDTGGIELKWGDQNTVEKLIHMTANRNGFGDLLAEGSLALGEKFNAEDEAIQVKGLEAPYHDPRGATGMALVYATSPRGACHKHSPYYMVDLGQTASVLGINYHSRLAGKEKSENVVRHQNWNTVVNSLVICTFANIPPDELAELINLATGYNYNVNDLLQTGERGWNLKRFINNRLGVTREADRLPKALLRAYEDSNNDGNSVVPDFQAMLDAYYTQRDWDKSSGIPKPAKLQELGLEWMLDIHSS